MLFCFVFIIIVTGNWYPQWSQWKNVGNANWQSASKILWWYCVRVCTASSSSSDELLSRETHALERVSGSVNLEFSMTFTVFMERKINLVWYQSYLLFFPWVWHIWLILMWFSQGIYVYMAVDYLSYVISWLPIHFY